VPLAALLDGWRALLPGAPAAVTWLDLAAAACLVWAALQRHAWRGLDAWSTPFDGLVLAMLALAAVGALNEGPAGVETQLLRQVVACAGAFYGLAFVLRSTPGYAEFAWRALAVTAAVTGAHAVWTATAGLGVLAHQATAMDARWTGSHGLAGTLAFATLVTGGRALERQALAPWRLAFLVGVIGLAAHATAGSLALGPLSLARLDAPMHFSTACVTWLFASALARAAWVLRKERRPEAWRWRTLALALAGFGAASVLGDGSGGEGVRALAVVAAGAILGAPSEVGPVREVEVDEAAPLARAA
jgi:hypothetical protein